MKTVSLIVNVYFRRSHADVTGTKFYTGFPTDEGLIAPQVKIVSMWIDATGIYG